MTKHHKMSYDSVAAGIGKIVRAGGVVVVHLAVSAWNGVKVTGKIAAKVLSKIGSK